MDVYATFLESVRRHRLLPAGGRVLAAVSGGSDSTALLHLLQRLRAGTGLELAVAHLDHGVRGEASREDARFTGSLAREMGLPFLHRQLDSGGRGRGSEAELRQARLTFLGESALEWGASRIALGHHREDQAETFLLRLLRGAGAGGLGGMRPCRSLPLASTGDGVLMVRPLLDIPRADLRTWLTQQRLTWREDASNADGRHLRNRIRKDLLPLLEELRPGATGVLARTAHLLRGDDDLLSDLAAVDPAADEAGQMPACRATWLEMPPPLARRRLRAAAARLAAVPGWAPGALQVERALARLRQGTPGSIDLGRGIAAEISSAGIFLRSGPAATAADHRRDEINRGEG